ncbi:MAG: SDR family NAD(P)-dependent oxidoreductase [Muribaculaceae bacterium]|nr:SDR family NAD(P)-dependent oxidoreductase [Muribaculaceae bacterium]
MGASSGIGYAVAEALASRGVKVGIAARHAASMEALKEKYPKFVEYMVIDVTKPDAKERMSALINNLGGMDIYFHVAGIGYENLYLDPEREVDIINTNAAGFARMICCAYRYFRDNGKKGQIAAITSVAGTKGIGRLSAYSSSKKFGQWYLDALEQLSNAEGTGISFTDIRPGWVRTPLVPDDRKFPMEMTVEHVLPLIIKAIVRKERVAVIDWRWNVLAGIWKNIPNALWTKMKVKISDPDSPLPTEAMQEREDQQQKSKEDVKM